MRTGLVLRGAWGAMLLARPDRVLQTVGGDGERPVRIATRVLGARQLGEALVMARAGETSETPRRATVIDVIHLASMLGFAAASPKLRRDALTSAGFSATLIALALRRRG